MCSYLYPEIGPRLFVTLLLQMTRKRKVLHVV